MMELPERTSEIIYVCEPELGFGNGQNCDHPKDGLYLYGPHAAPKQFVTINIGVVGTETGIRYFHSKLTEMQGFIPVPAPKKGDKEYRLHISHFPGLTEAFGIRVDTSAIVEKTLDAKKIDEATRNLNQHEAVRKAVDLYINEIEYHEANEELSVDVWVIVLPELVFERCKPQSKRTGLPLIK